MTKLVVVHVAEHLPLAYIIKARLESEGIAVHIGNEQIQDIIGEAPPGWSSQPRILVREEDAERARQILAEVERQGGLGDRDPGHDEAGPA